MKITEVIYFSHELDMLEAHLEESQYFANRIIIKESPCWFTGGEKPMYFTENSARFSRFKNVEVMVIPPEEYQRNIPEVIPQEEFKKWYDIRRNNRSKSRYYRWEDVCDGADYVLSMDCDEIILAERFHLIEEVMKTKEFEHIAMKFKQSTFFINRIGMKRSLWRCFRADIPHRPNPRGHPRFAVPDVVGWHFNNCFKSMEDLRNKVLGITTHLGYLGVGAVETASEMEDRLNRGKVPFTPTVDNPGNSYKKLSEVSFKDSPGKIRAKSSGLEWCPKWVRENPERFPWVEDIIGEGPFPDGIREAWVEYCTKADVS